MLVPNTKTGPQVAILLSTKNGGAYLGEQLQSLAAQTHENSTLYVSDDGSTDATRDILTQFAATHKIRLMVRDGPRRGFCQNFLSLLTDPAIQADFFALCDQDDVWYPEKLHRAIEQLSGLPSHLPALYGSRVELIDAGGIHRGYSPLFQRLPSFRNALVQNIAGGNTLVFNRSAKRLVEAAGILEVIAHDWWLYLLVSGAGGVVQYDPRPSVKYRQHRTNLIGSNIGWHPRLRRVHMLFCDRFRDWHTVNLAALEKSACLLSPESRQTLFLFKKARSSPSAVSRVYDLRKAGVYRQTAMGNIALITAGFLGKI